MFSSPEPKADRRAYSIVRHPLSVRRRRFLLTFSFSNDISFEAMKPILTKCHINHLGGAGGGGR